MMPELKFKNSYGYSPPRLQSKPKKRMDWAPYELLIEEWHRQGFARRRMVEELAKRGFHVSEDQMNYQADHMGLRCHRKPMPASPLNPSTKDSGTTAAISQQTQRDRLSLRPATDTTRLSFRGPPIPNAQGGQIGILQLSVDHSKDADLMPQIKDSQSVPGDIRLANDSLLSLARHREAEICHTSTTDVDGDIDMVADGSGLGLDTDVLAHDEIARGLNLRCAPELVLTEIGSDRGSIVEFRNTNRHTFAVGKEYVRISQFSDRSATTDSKSGNSIHKSTASVAEPSARFLNYDTEIVHKAYRRAAITVQSFCVRSKLFFTVGRVFAIETFENQRPTARKVIRRLVVVETLVDGCKCVRITTYGAQGLRRPGLSLQEINAHAHVFMSGSYARPKGPQSSKRALEVCRATLGQNLHRSSHIDFRNAVNFPYSGEVMDVGDVVSKDLISLRGYFELHRMDPSDQPC